MEKMSKGQKEGGSVQIRNGLNKSQQVGHHKDMHKTEGSCVDGGFEEGCPKMLEQRVSGQGTQLQGFFQPHSTEPAFICQ